MTAGHGTYLSPIWVSRISGLLQLLRVIMSWLILQAFTPVFTTLHVTEHPHRCAQIELSIPVKTRFGHWLVTEWVPHAS